MIERAARPLRGLANGIAGAMDGIYGALGGPGRLLQDFLNGSWLGHSLHAVIVDVVVGGATAALLLDLLRVVFGVDGLEDAATWVVGLAVVAGFGAALSGLTDYKDTPPSSGERDVTALHGVTNLVGWVLFLASLLLRLGDSHDGGFWVFLIGYLVISFGAYVGGHVVFKYGYTVNVNAFSKGKRAKEFTPVIAAADLPEGAPTKASFGSTAVMLVRRGDVVHALKDTCSHAGGPLSEGELKGDTITCPWHGSVFRITDGRVVHGPATTRQVRYDARINGDQVELQGPHD
ncbi:MAG TPA: Rieske 2Fe-2S domain-containing protein [Candidatus Limnocylindria bacterium]|nr:Rieske 2Fe-2S domain-containing protein [Candidatus Limnocylindria bacterium]